MIVHMIGSGDKSEVMAKTTAQMLMQSEVISHMFVMNPMHMIPVAVFVLCKSRTSIPFRCKSSGPLIVAPQRAKGSVGGGRLMDPWRWPCFGRLLLHWWQDFSAVGATPLP